MRLPNLEDGVPGMSVGRELGGPPGRSGQERRATVIGLGSMGSALAGAFVRAGVATTVWNRSVERAEALGRQGADVAETVAAAVSASRLIVVCVRDHASFRDVVGNLDPAVLADRTVVNMSSASPGEAAETAAWAAGRKIGYLNAAIMVPTPLIGTPAALVLYSGDAVRFAEHRDILQLVAGNADYLGADPGLAALYDVGMLTIFFAGMTAFLHAAAVASARGITAKAFLPYAEQIVSILPSTLAQLAADVDRGTYSGAEDNLTMELAALDHIVATSTASGVDPAVPESLRALARWSVDAGHGADGFSRIIDALRGRVLAATAAGTAAGT
jgi:3-hydroxyisobutyrate dehydrogenase-like beta-hydroxyacid dehydrogenase